MKKFVLKWDIMKTWPAVLWVLFFVLIAAFCGLISFIGYYYIKFQLEWFYIGYGVCLVSYFLIRGIGTAHIHHYVIAMIVISIIGYQTPFLTIIQGIFSGVMIEGSSRWGLDPIWGDNKAEEQEPRQVDHMEYNQSAYAYLEKMNFGSYILNENPEISSDNEN